EMLKCAALYLKLGGALDCPDDLICCAKDEMALEKKLLDILVSEKKQMLVVPAEVLLLNFWMVWLKSDRGLDVIHL
ncbi:hypothetical protein U1Q18_029280, partial [Sarracenia purpurea var. burkii]